MLLRGGIKGTYPLPRGRKKKNPMSPSRGEESHQWNELPMRSKRTPMLPRKESKGERVINPEEKKKGSPILSENKRRRKERMLSRREAEPSRRKRRERCTWSPHIIPDDIEVVESEKKRKIKQQQLSREEGGRPWKKRGGGV